MQDLEPGPALRLQAALRRNSVQVRAEECYIAPNALNDSVNGKPAFIAHALTAAELFDLSIWLAFCTSCFPSHFACWAECLHMPCMLPAQDAFTALGGRHFVVELKFDGERLQVSQHASYHVIHVLGIEAVLGHNFLAWLSFRTWLG